MASTEEITQLLEAFPQEDREKVFTQAKKYDELLEKLPKAADINRTKKKIRAGILALNGASGAGQSYVMARVERLLTKQSLSLPRIYLLGTRSPRPSEGHKDPYIFVEETPEGYKDTHNNTLYAHNDIYYRYQSRPGADNAILLADMKSAQENVMYLETVIPTLLHLRDTEISGIPALGNNLKIIYLAAPTGNEWVFRLLNREPSRLIEEKFQQTILGRLSSSLDDMQLAAEKQITCVLNHYGRAEEAAQEILTAWGL